MNTGKNFTSRPPPTTAPSWPTPRQSRLALTAQRQRLDSLWSQVRVGTPQSDREVSQLHSGDSFNVTCPVFLGSLTADEVDGRTLLRPRRFPKPDPHPRLLPHGPPAAENPDGWVDYTLTIPCPASGRFGMTARAVPSGTQWRSVSPPYITWAGA